MFKKEYRNKKIALKIVAVYSIVSFFWVLLTDWIYGTYIQYLVFRGVNWMPVLKGWSFILLTSVVFYKILEKNIIELEENEERYRKLVESSPEAIMVHILGEIVYINSTGVQLAGAKDAKEIIGRDLFDFIPREEQEDAKRRMIHVHETGERDLAEQTVLLPNGKTVFADMIAFKTTFNGNDAIQVIIRDISLQKKAEEKARYLAYYDSVTRLPNRHLFNEHLKQSLSRAKQKKQKVMVMLLDLDRFKVINDTLGHNFGDRLLQEVSKRLTSFLADNYIIARYGGDEFILLQEDASFDSATKLAQGIICELSSPLFPEGQQIYVSPSIGISVFPTNGESAEVIIQNAESAMYLAKEYGGNGYRFYDSELYEKNRKIMLIETGLRNALNNHEFHLVYQPQFDLASGKLIGAETLIRWKSSEHGFVSPGEFIPIAEETGLIVQIGEWVLETACKQNKKWQDEGKPTIRIAVNVSANQVRQSDFVRTVQQMLEKYKLDPQYLEIEITESVVQNIEEAMVILKRLKSLGVFVAIDDFGTGYSSLSYLRHLPIDKLKIDKSFVDDIPHNASGRAIVQTIIDMGNHLNFEVIAEGIENEQQAAFLRKYNCHYGQGYYYSKPLSASDMTRIMH